MKKIYIKAYTALNLGDDLFIKILCDRYPEHNFVLLCSKFDSKPFLKVDNLKIIYSIPKVDGLLNKLSSNLSFNLELEKYIIKKSDMIVHIGGSIFIEDSNWRTKVNQFQKILDTNKPYFIIGSNFGPYIDEQYYIEHKKIFEKTVDICFREEETYKLFIDLPQARLAPDVVFSLTKELIKTNQKSNTIIISVINLLDRKNLVEYTEIYESKIVEISKKIIDEGLKVTLMGFCSRQDDNKAIRRIVANIPDNYKESVKTYNYEGNITEALQEIKEAKGVIATRFHAMILGWLFEIPVYPLIYSSKMFNVIKDTKFSGGYTWIKDISHIEASNIVNQLISTKKIHDVSTQIKKAEEQFLNLDADLY